jgi:hypothetical protein
VTLWIAAGANPKEVAIRAGHSSVSFSLDRYRHLFPGSEQTLNDAIDALAEHPVRRHTDPRSPSGREFREKPKFHRAGGAHAGRFRFEHPRSLTL